MRLRKFVSCVLVYTILSGLVGFCWFTFSQNNNTTWTQFVHNYRLSRWESPIGLCSDRSSKQGFHQKVVSYSLFTTNDDVVNNLLKTCIRGIKKIHPQIRQFYPGWLMRIYTNDISLFEKMGIKSYLDENEKDIFVCDITRVNQSFIGNLSSLYGMMWRFLPVLDPTVDIFVSRDLDSHISARERSAVKQWEESGSIFHAMRDNPYHCTAILGGMWGAKNYLMDNNMTSSLRNSFLQIDRNDHGRGVDQSFLTSAVYSPFRNHIMQHDSYLCQRYPGSIPFPDQRPDIYMFVAGFNYIEVNNASLPECPVSCRPNYGKNWTHC